MATKLEDMIMVQMGLDAKPAVLLASYQKIVPNVANILRRQIEFHHKRDPKSMAAPSDVVMVMFAYIASREQSLGSMTNIYDAASNIIAHHIGVAGLEPARQNAAFFNLATNYLKTFMPDLHDPRYALND